jgi:hypothetical protein
MWGNPIDARGTGPAGVGPAPLPCGQPGWLPAGPHQPPPVLTDKNFLLAFLYAQYRGNQDDRWTKYVSDTVLSALKSARACPNASTTWA